MCSDTTFKYLIKNEETKKWFFEIINKKLNIDLNDYELIDNEDNSGNDVKDYRMDVVFKKGNTIVIIEMTNGSSKSNYIKSYQYLYRVASRRFLTGKKYYQNETKLILFNGFYNQENRKVYNSHFTFTDKDNNLIIKDIESFEIYLPNYKVECYDKYDEIDKRLVLFNAKSYEEMERLIDNQEDLEILKELKNLGMSRIFLTEYEKEKVQKKLVNSAYDDGLEDGLEQGLEQGLKQGFIKRNIDIARKMLVDNIDIKTISKYTNLSINEIKQL